MMTPLVLIFHTNSSYFEGVSVLSRHHLIFFFKPVEQILFQKQKRPDLLKRIKET